MSDANEKAQAPPDQARDAAPPDKVRRSYLLALAFVCGACVMTVEMAGQKALTPHFGSSTYVWTNVIGVILAALSVGYMVGGRIADRTPRPVVLLGIVAAAGLLCLLVPLIVHHLGEAMIPDGLNQQSAFRIVYLGSFFLTLLLFAPPVFLLAMVSPFVIRLLVRETGEVGRAAGKVYAFSTVGSILGTFLPTLVLLPWVGTSATLLISAGALTLFAASGILLFLKKNPVPTAALIALPILPAALIGPGPVKGGDDTLYEHESSLHYIRVYDRGDGTALALNEGLQTCHSFLPRDRVIVGGAYADDLLALPLHFDPALRPRLRVFVAGLAAGVISLQMHHFYDGLFELEIDGAEIDPAVLRAGRLFFGLGGPKQRNLHPVVADGRLALHAAQQAYDLIIVDAYANQMYIPFSLATVEFFRLARDKLTPGGMISVNVADFGPGSPVLSAVRNTLASVFDRVDQVRVRGDMNYLLMARRDGALDSDAVFARLQNPALRSRSEVAHLGRIVKRVIESKTTHYRDPSGTCFTDDHAPVERLVDRSFREARSQMADLDALPQGN